MSPAPVILVTVAVCTRDRPSQLCALLNSLRGLVIPSGLHWEMLVIDNGIDDASAEVVESFVSTLPIRRVKAPVPGLSRARNCAIREARGDYICWVDDDTIVDRNWLTAYFAAFRRHPDAAIFGGKILRKLEEPVPLWLRKSLETWEIRCAFAHRNVRHVAPLHESRDHTPWGANFAVRTIEQKRFEYDPALGIAPEHNRAGEESDLICRMLACGCTGWWVPEAIVHHVVGRDRQTWSYLYFYFARAGETAAYVQANFADQENAGRRLRSRLANMGRVRLFLYAACRWALFLAAAAARLFPLSVRFLAGAGFYAGVLNHLRNSTRHPSSSPGSEPLVGHFVQ